MSNEKTLNELRKATLASYLSKAGSRIRAGTSLGKTFYDDAGKPLKQVLKHSPNVYDPKDPEGKHKDPAKLAAAQKDYDTQMKLSDTFRRQAKNTIKGVALAGKKLAKEEVVNEVSRSTIAKVATKRYQQAQAALKNKDYGGYVKKMQKAIKAGDATTPKTGWSHEEEVEKTEGEPIVEVSAAEKYRQIKEAKARKGLRGYGPPPADAKAKKKNFYNPDAEGVKPKKRMSMGDLPADVKLHGD